MVGCQNIPCVGNKPILDDLIRTLGHNIAIENDANCFALAEAVIGAGKGHDLVFGVILGTGCGGSGSLRYSAQFTHSNSTQYSVRVVREMNRFG